MCATLVPHCDFAVACATRLSNLCKIVGDQSRSAECKRSTSRWLAESKLARPTGQAKRRSAFAKATARQSTLTSTTRAKAGGKGIRTPDFQLAKLALYQLSYAPDTSADCRLPIADCKWEGRAHHRHKRVTSQTAISTSWSVSAKLKPDGDMPIVIRHSCASSNGRSYVCALRKRACFVFISVR